MRKTRAAVVGTNAYPYLILYFYELFKQFWYDEVDKVYFAISSAEHKTVWPRVKNYLSQDPKVVVIETNKNWPDSLNEVARSVTEDLLFFPHDDTLIYKKGVVDGYFKIVEETGKVVTPLTGIYTPPDLTQELMKRQWPDQLPFTLEGSEPLETGYSFYCNMFFIDGALFRKTSMDFGIHRVEIGQRSELLDWTPLTTPLSSDTNFLLCLELLKLGVQFHIIPKYEIASLYNEPEPAKALAEGIKSEKGPYSKDAGWIHLQTMAYHIYGMYFDLGVREELERTSGGPVAPLINNNHASLGIKSFYWSTLIKLAWIREFMTAINCDSLGRYHLHVLSELGYIMNYVKISETDVETFRKAFHYLIWNK